MLHVSQHVMSALLPREKGRWSLSEGYKNRVVMERSVPRIAKDRTMARCTPRSFVYEGEEFRLARLCIVRGHTVVQGVG